MFSYFSAAFEFEIRRVWGLLIFVVQIIGLWIGLWRILTFIENVWNRGSIIKSKWIFRFVLRKGATNNESFLIPMIFILFLSSTLSFNTAVRTTIDITSSLRMNTIVLYTFIFILLFRLYWDLSRIILIWIISQLIFPHIVPIHIVILPIIIFS